MQFLVTGGAGFLGTDLCNRLARDGHVVRAIDDLSAGEPSRLEPAVFFTRGDVADIPKLWSLLQGVDCVYHLAARVSVPQSILYPRDYNTVNVGGTVALMEAVRDAGVKRVVLTSSGAVYGQQAQQPVREEVPPNPDSPYAVSKLSAEYYVRTIGALWKIETVILRIFNAYGPGQALPVSHAPVVPQFINHAIGGGSLVIFGDGEQTRDFVYLDDVTNALVAAATAANVDREILNVGCGHETSINELIKHVERAVGRNVAPLRNTAVSGGVQRLYADISRAQRLLDFRPRTSLDDGLRLTLLRDRKFQPTR
ncbi:MAG TPA: NAD-dependent epimerase/dehydratase family protein [Anaerolineae bacterium]|nr:NAD-dependent epimerase/dehydratase family protein [Anaerolineae bacterium]